MRPRLARALAPLTLMAAAACGVMPAVVAPTAPPGICLEPGTPLIFAGRSTTAALGVQEVLGDPMSHVPADIYITRDEFAQGELRGRLVCAVYTEPAGFTEVTVVPEGWEPGGMRPPDPPTPEPTPVPEQPASGIARADAIAIARQALPDSDGLELGYVSNGPPGDLLLGMESFDWALAVPGDAWLWQVTLERGNGEGTTVFIDYADGTVYGWFDWIS